MNLLTHRKTKVDAVVGLTVLKMMDNVFKLKHTVFRTIDCMSYFFLVTFWFIVFLERRKNQKLVFISYQFEWFDFFYQIFFSWQILPLFSLDDKRSVFNLSCKMWETFIHIPFVLSIIRSQIKSIVGKAIDFSFSIFTF